MALLGSLLTSVAGPLIEKFMGNLLGDGIRYRSPPAKRARGGTVAQDLRFIEGQQGITTHYNVMGEGLHHMAHVSQKGGSLLDKIPIVGGILKMLGI